MGMFEKSFITNNTCCLAGFLGNLFDVWPSLPPVALTIYINISEVRQKCQNEMGNCNLPEVKDNNIHVKCTLSSRAKCLSTSVVSNSDLNGTCFYKISGQNTVVDTVDDDSRPGVANVSSANTEGHVSLAIQAAKAGFFCSSFTKTFLGEVTITNYFLKVTCPALVKDK